MYSWIVGRVLRALIGRLTAGDVQTLVRGYAPDAQLIFPGDSSFAGVHRGRDAIEAWLERFSSLGPSFEVHDVLVAGPPWSMRIGFCFSDRIPLPGGDDYENHGMEHIRTRWGRIVEQRVYLDTERVAELDARLGAAEAARQV